MPSTGLAGSFPLTHDEIDKVVRVTSPGTYALGDIDPADRAFAIARVGRSDNDLNDRLHDYVGKYRRFKAGYSPNAKAAFEKECHLFHDFSPPDNYIHPDRPNGTNRTCPRCLIFD
jgi:hypothetical protein